MQLRSWLFIYLENLWPYDCCFCLRRNVLSLHMNRVSLSQTLNSNTLEWMDWWESSTGPSTVFGWWLQSLLIAASKYGLRVLQAQEHLSSPFEITEGIIPGGISKGNSSMHWGDFIVWLSYYDQEIALLRQNWHALTMLPQWLRWTFDLAFLSCLSGKESASKERQLLYWKCINLLSHGNPCRLTWKAQYERENFQLLIASCSNYVVVQPLKIKRRDNFRWIEKLCNVAIQPTNWHL